jgi:hypothetical protein
MGTIAPHGEKKARNWPGRSYTTPLPPAARFGIRSVQNGPHVTDLSQVAKTASGSPSRTPERPSSIGTDGSAMNSPAPTSSLPPREIGTPDGSSSSAVIGTTPAARPPTCSFTLSRSSSRRRDSITRSEWSRRAASGSSGVTTRFPRTGAAVPMIEKCLICTVPQLITRAAQRFRS